MSGQRCAPWLCTLTSKISVAAGNRVQGIIGDWSNTALRHGNRFHGGEFIFTNIPSKFNVENATRYSVTHEAMTAPRGFMVDVTSRTLEADFGGPDYSSDWVETMWSASDSSACCQVS